MQSSTIKLYVLAIKHMLLIDGYEWNDKKMFLLSFTRACKLINDRMHIRLPIHCSFLELILFEIRRLFSASQPYLPTLYQTMFALGYYGLMRIGELTKSSDVLRAKNIHITTNKEKILLVLYSLKTHSKVSKL